MVQFTMRQYQYAQSSPSDIYKRIPEYDEDHMRQCYPYQDEQEYSAIQGVEEAIKAGLTKRSEILVYVMKKYRGHLNPEIAMKAIDIIMQ